MEMRGSSQLPVQKLKSEVGTTAILNWWLAPGAFAQHSCLETPESGLALARRELGHNGASTSVCRSGCSKRAGVPCNARGRFARIKNRPAPAASRGLVRARSRLG